MYHNPTSTASFDLRPLKEAAAMNKGVISTTGGDVPCTETQEKNYTYYVGICGPVPASSLPKSTCTDSDLAKVEAANSYAVQVTVDGTCAGADCHCHSAGIKQGTDGNAYMWSLINDNDPTVGVALTYPSGEQCHRHSGESVAPDREMTVRFLCSNTVAATPSRAEEISHCHYEVDIQTIYGCPTQCGTENGKLCGGHGICAFDKTNKKAKCFCDDGWGGNDTCDTEEQVQGNPVVTLLVLVVLVCTALGVGVFMLFRQIKSYQSDTQNYLRLQGSPLGDDDTV